MILSTEFQCIEEHWTGSEYSNKEANYQTKNSRLREMLRRIEMKILELESSDKLVDMGDRELKEILIPLSKGKSIKQKDFLFYFDEFMSQKKNSGTKTVYQTTRNKLEEFDLSCTFDSIDKKWLSSFENWMIGSGMKVNAYAIHLRNIRAVFNYCIDEEYTDLYPFRKFKIKKEETRKRSLTVEQLTALRDYPCEEYQKRYRDMFMLMFYLIGVNASDLFNAKHADVVNGRLEYKRAKTGKLYSIKIEPEAMEIIGLYKGKNYLLNIMDEYGNYKDFLHRMGIGLKQIGECKRVGRGGKKVIDSLCPDISSYWSRHTWATIAHKIGIPKDIISMALGHSFGVSTTDIYINYDNEKVDIANRQVLDSLK